MKRLLLFFLALATLPAGAAVKFVNAAASGANSGSSWANGWTNVTGIGWAGLAPGDIVCIAGGSYATITTAKSGTSGNPITLRRATAADATCGSSTSGWSSGFDAQVVVTGIVLHNDYVTIDGAVNNGITAALHHGDDWVVGVNGPTTGVTLQYVEVAGPCGTSACNQSNDDRNLSLINWNGSSYDLQTNFHVIHDNFHGGCTLLITYNSTGLVVDHTRFADSADSTPGNPNCHPNVLESGGDVNATFRYNEVTNWQVEGIMVCPNGGCSANWDVYGNIWHDPMAGSTPRQFEVQGNANGPHHFYNNTIVNLYTGTLYNTANGGSYASGSLSKNNLYWSSGTGGVGAFDYDLCNSSCGETHGQTYTNTNLFNNYASKDYTLALDTTAGTTLSSPFATDLNGTARAANGTWDRGYYQIPTTSHTWFVRAGGGTRQQCTGLSDTDYPGSGTGVACAFNDFRYMWSPNDGTGTVGTWMMAGGDTVVVRGCHALGSQQNPANPTCRIGEDNDNNGNPPNSWCPTIGTNDCTNPAIPVGTAGQHTRILSGCAYDSTPGPCNSGNVTNRANLTQLFGGFGLRWTLNFSGAQYVDFQGFEVTTHNGACSHHGAPPYPKACSTSVPIDDYADNGLETSNTTSHVLLQDVYLTGFESAGINGPIGGPVTINRGNLSYNAAAGWQMADQADTPNAAGSQLIMTYVTGIGNGCKKEYPEVDPFPALACYDDNSAGFGDFISGQDTTLDVLTCDHCVIKYNTKDAFIGPHAQVGSLTITNSVSIGNMGAQWKWGSGTNSNVTFANNLTVGNCRRMSEQLVGARQNFNISTGLGGSYLSDFCRGDAVMANLTRAGSTNHFYGNTVIAANDTVISYNCGYVDAGGVHEETNCQTSPLVWTGNEFHGYVNPAYGTAPGLWFFDPGAGGSLVNTSTFNNEFGIRNGDTCGVNNITCVDPLLKSEPAQTWPGSEAALDVFNPSGGSGNSFYPTSGSPLRGAGTTLAGLTTDYYGMTRPNPNPGLGGVEFIGGAPTLVSIAVTPNPGAVNVSSTLAMTCTATFSDSSTAPCSSPVWTNTAVHSSVNSSTGVVTGTSSGSDTVTATIGSVSGNATVNVSALPVVATPSASPNPGTYTSTQTVTLSDATSGAAIYYTTDGSTPTGAGHGTLYTSAITVSSTTTIKALGTKAANTNSSVATFVYTITAATGIEATGTFQIQGKQ